MMTDAPAPMLEVTIDGLDLAALVTSRVCHDVASPAGAIVNSIELYDTGDPSTKEFALDLVRKSSRQVSARVQFARIAFGAAGSAGATVDTGDADSLAKGFFQDEKVSVTWELPRALLPKNQVKLLLNLLLVGAKAIPRGGVLTVTGSIAGDQGTFQVRAQGANARIPHLFPDIISGKAPNGVLDAHGIQPFFTGLTARASRMSVAFEVEGDVVTITATPNSE